jgi:SagB-type dehydrogenase family enzyme
VERETGREFFRKTRYECLAPSDQSRGVEAPPPVRPLPAGAVLTALPPAEGLIDGPELPFRTLVGARRSVREYSAEPISVSDLAYLLWCTQGVKVSTRSGATLRTVPSAGARHALETHVLVNRVEELPPGLYRYEALEHGLFLVAGGPRPAAELTEACLGQSMVSASAVTLVWSAVPYRMTWRYGERGYRYLLLDAGHARQNLYLAGEALGLGVCAIAAFEDELLDAAIGVDGESEFALYVATVGPPKTGP